MPKNQENNLAQIFKAFFSSNKDTEISNEDRGLILKLFENIPAVVYARDGENNLIIASKQAKETLGLIKSKSKSVMSETFIRKDEELDKTVLDKKKTVEENITYISAEGRARIAAIKKIPLILEGRKPTVVLTFFVDNTDRLAKELETVNSKDLLKSILDNAPMAIYTRGTSGGLTFWNKKAMEMFEDDEESIAKSGAHPMQSVSDVEGYKAREGEILQEGKVVIYPQEPYTTRNGNKLMLHITKIPIPASGDAAECVLTIAQDITERYFQEQENAKNQNFIQTILNNAPLAIYARDSEGNMIFRNKKSSEIHGYNLGELPNETKEQVEFYKQREQKIFKGKKPVVLGEEEYTGNDGVKRVLRAVKAPIFDAQNKPLMVVTISEDITEQQKQTLEILHTKNFLNEIIDNLPVALYAKDYDGKYILWNKKSAEVFGKTAKEVLGKTHYNDALNPEQREFIQMQDKKVFDMRKELDIPQELISTQNDGIKIMHTVKMPLFYEDGSPHCLLAISEDITLKTKMEKQVYEAKTQYSLLVENCREGILTIEQGKISFANKTLLSALHYTEQDLQDKKFLDFIADEHKGIAEEFYDRINSQTAAQEFVTLKLKSKNDEMVDFETSGIRAKYLGKRIVVLFLRNIAKELSQGSGNKQSKDTKFKLAFDSLKTPQVILQQNGYIYDMNRSARRIFGFSVEDRPLYGSIFIIPGFPLKARKALSAVKPLDFEASIDFDHIKKTVPEIIKEGKIKVAVKMTPFNIRLTASGKKIADFLLDIQEIDDTLITPDEVNSSITGADILAYKDGILLCSQQGVILKCNKEAEELLGKNAVSLKEYNLTELFELQDAMYLKKDIEELYNQGNLEHREYLLNRDFGSLTLECEAVLAKNNNFILSFRNNTGKRQLLEVLEERTSYTEALKKCLGGAMLECLLEEDKGGNISFTPFTNISTEACTLSGYRRQELGDKSLFDLLCTAAAQTKSEKAQIITYLNKKAHLLKEGQTVNFEAKIAFKDRTTICSLTLTSYKTAGEDRVIVVLKEIAREIEIADSLTQASKELEGIKECLEGIYLKLNKDGKVVSCGIGKGAKLVGLSAKEVLDKKLEEFLPKEEAKDIYRVLKDTLKNNTLNRGTFSLKQDDREYFYEYSLSALAGENKAQMFISNMNTRRGFEEKIKHLYTLLNRPNTSFVENMDAILNYGNKVFNAQAGLICHFSGSARNKILVNYVTDNKIKLEKDMTFKIGQCLNGVKEGKIIADPDLQTLDCTDCLHDKKGLEAVLAAPLTIKGKAEGIICFVSTNKNEMFLGDQEQNLISFMANLMSMALETRQAKKATSNSLATMRHLMRTLDVPSLITDEDLCIKNANDTLCSMFEIYDLAEIDDRELFPLFATNPEKAKEIFYSSLKTSKGGVFDFIFEVKLPDLKRMSLLWHVVEIKDGRGTVRGYMFASESIKDLDLMHPMTNGRYHGV